MGRMSDSQANSILNAVFGGATYTPVPTMYVALSTTTPANDGSGVNEPAGNGYARVAVANNATNWAAAVNRAKTNGTVITFPTASGSWGTVNSFALYDAATAGNFVGWGNLLSPQVIPAGSSPDFPVGSLSVSFPGS